MELLIGVPIVFVTLVKMIFLLLTPLYQVTSFFTKDVQNESSDINLSFLLHNILLNNMFFKYEHKLLWVWFVYVLFGRNNDQMRRSIISSNQNNGLSITHIAEKRIVKHMIIWMRFKFCTHSCRKFISDAFSLLIFQQRKFVTISPISLFPTLLIINKYKYKGIERTRLENYYDGVIDNKKYW